MTESKGFLKVNKGFPVILREVYKDSPQKRFGKYNLYFWKVIAYLFHSYLTGRIDFSKCPYNAYDKFGIKVAVPIHRIIDEPDKDKCYSFMKFVNKNWGKHYIYVYKKRSYFIFFVKFTLFSLIRFVSSNERGFVKLPFRDLEKVENIYDFICVYYRNSLCKKYDEIAFSRAIKDWKFLLDRKSHKTRDRFIDNLAKSALKFNFKFFVTDDSNIVYLRDYKWRKRFERKGAL